MNEIEKIAYERAEAKAMLLQDIAKIFKKNVENAEMFIEMNTVKLAHCKEEDREFNKGRRDGLQTWLKKANHYLAIINQMKKEI